MYYHFADTNHRLAKPYEAGMRLTILAAHLSGAMRIFANGSAMVLRSGLHGTAVESGADLVEKQEYPSIARAYTRSLVDM